MGSLLAKFIVFISLLLSSIIGPSYIQTNFTDPILDFKTGDSFPVTYILNVGSVGPERAIFKISSDTSWVFVYRESQPNAITVEMGPGDFVNFIIEAYPNQAADGTHEVTVKLEAIHLTEGTIYDTKDINITVNKNVVAEETQVPEESTPTPEAVLPTPTKEPELIVTVKPTPAMTPVSSPTKLIPTSVPTIAPTPAVLEEGIVPKRVSSSPTPIPVSEPVTKSERSVIRVLFDFIKRLFF